MEGELLTAEWNPAMILLSYGFSFIGALVGVTLSEQFRIISVQNEVEITKLASPKTILVLMSIAIGGVSIWSMHFIGMTALVLKRSNGEVVPIYYSIVPTILSLLAAICGVNIAVYICSLDRVFTKTKEEVLDMLVEDARKAGTKITSKFSMMLLALLKGIFVLIFGGATLAAGVCIMHYVGMVAMKFPGYMKWNIGIVVLSVVIAMTVSVVGLWILFRFLALYPTREIFRIISAAVIAVAVCSMHYTGMYGAKYYYDPSRSFSTKSTIDSDTALYTALVFGMAVSWILISIAITDIRARNYMQSKIIAETDDMVQKIRNTNGDAEVNALLSKFTNKTSNRPKVEARTAPNRGSFFALMQPGRKNSVANAGHEERKSIDVRKEPEDAVLPFALERNLYDANRKRQSLGIESWASARPAHHSVAIDRSAHPKSPRKRLTSVASNV